MPSAETIDSLDARILLALDKDPDTTTIALARRLGIARNTAHARLRHMTESGALTSFSHRVDPAAVGHGLVAFVSLAISQARSERAVAELARIPQVLEMHATTGDMDLLLKVVARDTDDLYRITNAMLSIDGVGRSNTTISLRTPVSYRIEPLLRHLYDTE
jgi:DNA-binding Lrp family transcriptional regulator